jgi:AcrR family transcriptional regulator
VLAAARDLFFGKGYRATTVEQIARRAGYSKRTVYLEFRNKDDLAICLCAEGLEMLHAELAGIPVDRLDLDTSIERYLETYIAFSRRRPSHFRMIFSEATPRMVARCSPETRARVQTLERACLGGVVRWAERAIGEGRMSAMDPWDAAGMFVGAATGVILLTMGGSQTVFAPKRLRDLVRRAVLTMWCGLQASAMHEQSAERVAGRLANLGGQTS